MKLLSRFLITISIFFSLFTFTGCNNNKIKMYDINSQKVLSIDFEDYVAGATAAEIDTSFGTAAIEAQSIIARTFAVYFMQNKKSKYAGADISNDITEAQGYTSNIPKKIKTCCNNTKGKILIIDNNIFYPLYCSNVAGKTSLPQDIFEEEIAGYYQVESFENEDNSKNYSFVCNIDKSSILFAMQKLGKNLASVNSFEVEEKDTSGRAIKLLIGGVEVSANSFRMAIGSDILKSTKITNIVISQNNVEISGLGYGHGVGLSQYGANILSGQNKTYEEILKHYYPDCNIKTINKI